MKKSYVFMFVVFFSVVFLAQFCLFGVGVVRGQVADSWVGRASMSVARMDLGVAVVGGKIYAIGGYGRYGPILSINEEYDPVNDSWVLKAPMPTARMNFGIAVYADKIYCIGGYGGATANEVYDPLTDTWTSKAAFPSVNASSLQANVVGDEIFVVDGVSGLNYVYDPVMDSWALRAKMPNSPVTFGSFASALVDGKIFVVDGGVYDPVSDSWVESPLPLVFYSFGAATTGTFAPKRIYIFGSSQFYFPYDLPTTSFVCEAFDPVSGNWSVCASMPTGRLDGAVAVLNDTLYVVGGGVPFLANEIDGCAVVEQYIPLGYGLVVSPSPSATPSSSVSASASVEPSSSATDSLSPAVFDLNPVVVGIVLVLMLCLLAVTIAVRRHLRFSHKEPMTNA